MALQAHPFKLIEECITTAKVIGIENTLKGVMNLRCNPDLDKVPLRKKVIKIICRVYKISEEELMNSRSQGIRTEALTTCYVIMHTHLNYSGSDLQQIFQKDKSNIHKAITKFNQLNEANKYESKILKRAHRAIDMCKELIATYNTNGTKTND